MVRTWIGAAVLPLFAACAASPTQSPPAPEPEVERGPVQLLVERFTRGGSRDFYVMEPDGSRVGSFPTMPREVIQVVPSPDGRTLAQLVQLPTGEVHLWLADRDGRSRRPLLTGDRWVASVAWSPDSSKLAVSQTTLDTELDVWVVGADGSGLADLTPDPDNVVFFDANPSWSPDGARIVFASNRSGTYTHLYTVTPGGAEPRPLLAASQTTLEHHPVWSPDGGHIAFIGGEPGAAVGIGLVTPDGQGYRILGPVGRPESLAWSPDGRLLYASAAAANYEIYALDTVTGLSQDLTGTAIDHDFRAVPLRSVASGPWLGFAPLARYTSDRPAPLTLATGDLEGDGAVDLVSLQPSLGQVRLHQGLGGGALRELGGLDAPASPRALVVAGVDRGEALDVAALGESEAWVWRGSLGGPGTAEVLPLPGQGRAMVAGDFSWVGSSQLAMLVESDGGAMRLVILRALWHRGAHRARRRRDRLLAPGPGMHRRRQRRGLARHRGDHARSGRPGAAPPDRGDLLHNPGGRGHRSRDGLSHATVLRRPRRRPARRPGPAAAGPAERPCGAPLHRHRLRPRGRAVGERHGARGGRRGPGRRRRIWWWHRGRPARSSSSAISATAVSPRR